MPQLFQDILTNGWQEVILVWIRPVVKPCQQVYDTQESMCITVHNHRPYRTSVIVKLAITPIAKLHSHLGVGNLAEQLLRQVVKEDLAFVDNFKGNGDALKTLIQVTIICLMAFAFLLETILLHLLRL